MQGEQIVIEAIDIGGNYLLDLYKYERINNNCRSCCVNSCVYSLTKSDKAYLWHCRFGHLNAQYLKKIARENLVANFDLSESDIPNNFNCKICLEGKSCKLPFKTSYNRASAPLELIHSDVAYIRETSNENCNYYVTFLDDYSHYCFCVYT